MDFLGGQERQTDPETSLIQMGARSYAPELGVFLSKDPVLGAIGIGISVNRYPYVWDNPLALFDLYGRFPSLSGVAGAVWGTVDSAWDASAGARDSVGLAGNGNVGMARDTGKACADTANHA